MSAHAVASVNASSINGGNGTYDVTIQFSATLDGTTNFSNQTVVRIPFSNDAKHANTYVRVTLAAYALSQYGLTIDPDDIYFPI